MKKINFLWILLAMPIILSGGLYFLLSPLCSTEIIGQIPSPNGKHNISWIIINCGATTDYETTIKLDSNRRGLFQIKGSHDSRDLEVTWLSDNQLKINYDGNLSLIRHFSTTSDDVTVEYFSKKTPISIECLYPDCAETQAEMAGIKQLLDEQIDAGLKKCKQEGRDCSRIEELQSNSMHD